MNRDERLSDLSDGNHADASPPRSYWPVALSLFGLVAVMLGAAFILNRQLRPPVGIEPSSGGTPPARAEIAAPSPTATPAVESPTWTPQTVASSGQAAVRPAATTSPTNAPSGSPSPELSDHRAVEQAYLRYWDVYREALLQLDTSRLSEVSARDELREIEEEIEEFRQRGRAVRATVTHHYLVFDVTELEAKVYDEIMDRSFTVDPVTKEPTRGPDSGSVVKDTFFFEKIDGVWKVIKSVRHEG